VGTVYWYLVAIVHRWIFARMLKALGRKVEQRAAASDEPSSSRAVPAQR
jgi:hypothetical protein